MGYKDTEKRKAYARRHYRDNKDVYKRSALASKTKTKALTRERKDTPCLDCGISYPHYVMDLDHVRGIKLDKVSSLQTSGSRDKLAKEMDKCEAVCANCHRERTHKRKYLPL